MTPALLTSTSIWPQVLDDLFRYAGRIALAGHVQGEGLRVSSTGAYLVDNLRQALQVASGDGDPRAFPGKGQGNGPSYAAAGAGNQWQPYL